MRETALSLFSSYLFLFLSILSLSVHEVLKFCRKVPYLLDSTSRARFFSAVRIAVGLLIIRCLSFVAHVGSRRIDATTSE